MVNFLLLLIGTIHFLENIEQLDRAFVDALSGVPSNRFLTYFDTSNHNQFELSSSVCLSLCFNRPFIEMTIPSSLDDSLSPPGQHVVQLFTQYAPYHLKNGKSWDDSATKEEYAKSCYNGSLMFPLFKMKFEECSLNCVWLLIQ